MYKEMKLYNEIKAEMKNVIEAENNAASWKREADARMKDVGALIVAAQKVNKDVTIDRKELIAEIRADLNPTAVEPEPEPENATSDNA